MRKQLAIMTVLALVATGCSYDECYDECDKWAESCGLDVECDTDALDNDDIQPEFGRCPNVETPACNNLYKAATELARCARSSDSCWTSAYLETVCYYELARYNELYDAHWLSCYDID